MNGRRFPWEYSADGRTLYLGIARAAAEIELATVALDAFTGAAVVDAEGRWKVLAPIAQVDGTDAFLCGVGAGGGTDAKGTGFAPLTVARFGEETIGTLPPDLGRGLRPVYGIAILPAISPDAKRIAFGSLGGGLWLADPTGKYIRKILTSVVNRPRWSIDGKFLYFLAPRPTAGDRPRFDLYRLTADSLSAPPKKMLEDLDWFAVAPD